MADGRGALAGCLYNLAQPKNNPYWDIIFAIIMSFNNPYFNNYPSDLTHSAIRLRDLLKQYNGRIDVNTRIKNFTCISTGLATLGVWAYRQFDMVYLPSTAVILTHSMCHYQPVNTWIHDGIQMVFNGNTLRHIGYRCAAGIGVYCALEYSFIKFLQKDFCPYVYKFALGIRYFALGINIMSLAAIGCLYVPRIQQALVSYFARVIHRNYWVSDFNNLYQGVLQLPSSNTEIADYTRVAETISDYCALNENIGCSICMQDAETIVGKDKNQMAKMKTCKHAFCIPCINHYLAACDNISSARCPMCRTTLMPGGANNDTETRIYNLLAAIRI